MGLELVGDEELLAAFRELDFKTQHRRLHSVLSHVGNIPAKAMRQAIPVRKEKLSPPSSASRARRSARGGLNKFHPPGLGRRSIMKKRGRSKGVATLFVGPRTGTGSYKTDAFYLRIWDLYNPGGRKIINAAEWALQPTQQAIYNSMRTIIQRAWNKKVKK
ncbi:hypothetical protein LCGC14_1576060 [marine sediment metagenome]|uniref:Uncharacterized protein n=1 Tax=marine sediment metagenome TaxID=412755 RepID=A0A0F9IID5_9ZZZZ